MTLGDNHGAAADNPAPVRSLNCRLLALQTRLSAAAVRNIALSLPFWSLLIAVIFGGFVPEMGEIALSLSWPWIALCTAATSSMLIIARFVAKSPEEGLDRAIYRNLVTAGYLAIAASWSLVTPIFWQPDNLANHVLLLLLAVGAASLFLNSRCGQFTMVLSATMPILGSIWFQLLHIQLWFDLVFAVILPVWVIQLHLDSWRACGTIAAAHRTTLEMETVAAKLVIARDEAAAASRAKSSFVANMSHELRTPLNAIIGFSQIIQQRPLGDNPERYSEYAGDILRSGRHLLGLINDMLDVAKIEAGKLELDCQWIDATIVMRECVAIIADSAREKSLTLGSEASPAELRLFADERAFRQIFINLLSNAIKFTPSGGHIEARLQKRIDGGIVLSVRDTGCGIASDQIGRLFQPFEQADNRYARAHGGTGLGLTLVRALTELHGGRCGIESELGKGTTVRIFLPVPQTQAQQQHASSVAA